MALTSTLYRFDIDLSDVDRGVYDRLELRVPMHPSETVDSLLTRVLAYCLELEPGLALGKGLCAGEEPALTVTDPTGVMQAWIDVGSPAAERIHRAAKAAPRVAIYTYKDADLLRRNVQGERIHRADRVQVCAMPRDLLTGLGTRLDRTNVWTVVHTEGTLYVTAAGATHEGILRRMPLVETG